MFLKHSTFIFLFILYAFLNHCEGFFESCRSHAWEDLYLKREYRWSVRGGVGVGSRLPHLRTVFFSTLNRGSG